MTDDLATTGAQVVPVLALGAVIAYRARVRAYEQLLRPLSSSVKEFSRQVVDLHEQGLRGAALIDAVERQGGGGIGAAYVLRIAAVVAVLATILANLAAELICLAVLSAAVAPRAWHAAFVLCAITAGLVVLVVVPLIANAPTWGLARSALRTPEYARALAIIEQAGRDRAAPDL